MCCILIVLLKRCRISCLGGRFKGDWQGRLQGCLGIIGVEQALYVFAVLI